MRPLKMQQIVGMTACVSRLYLHHGGHWMNPVHVPDEALRQVSYTQTDGPVGVTLQFDHLVCAER